MKEFVKKLLQFGFCTLLTAGVVQVVLTIRMKGKSSNGNDVLTVYKGQKNDILFMGSSRAANHFIPAIFREKMGLQSVNIGIPGHDDLNFQVLMLRNYLSYNPPPKNLVLNFDPGCKYGPLDYPKNTHDVLKDYFARYAYFLEEDNEDISAYYRYNVAEKYIPLYALLKYRIIISCILLHNGQRVEKARGYQKRAGVWDYRTDNPDEQKIAGFEPKFSKAYDSIKAQLAYFHSICTHNGINLICVQTPLAARVYGKVNFEPVSRMCSELSIPFFDYEGCTLSHQPEYFANPLHLNETGARLFCEMICDNREFRSALSNK